MSVDRKPATGVTGRSRAAADPLDEQARILFVFAVALLLICLAAIVSGLAAAAFGKPPDLAALQMLFIEENRGEVRPEPVERAAYLAAILTALPAVLVAVSLLHPVGRRVRFGSAAAMAGTLLASVLLVVVFVRSDLMVYLLGGNVSGKFDHSAGISIFLMVGVAAIATAFVIFRAALTAPQTDGVQGGSRHKLLSSRVANIVSVTAVLLAVVAVRIRSDTTIYGDPHFEAVFYAMSQVMAGRTLLADLPAQYGLYAELLRPLFSITGLSVLKFTVLMTTLQGIACFALLAFCARTMRLAWLRCLAVLTLSMVVGSTWIAISDSPQGHEYYQLWPIRFFFPAISLLAFLATCRRGMSQHWVGLTAALAGIAIVWNLESGIAVFGALVACLLVRLLFGDPSARGHNARLFLTGLLLPIAVVAVFFLFLFFKSDGRIQLLEWAKYQTIFYSTGFGMLPMSLRPHPWMAVLGVYLYGIAGAVLAHFERKPSVSWDVILYLSIVGLGLFTYYQGRSHDVVLSFVIWPAILVTFLLADQTLRAVRAGRLPRPMAWSTAAVIVFGILISLQWLIGVPKLVGMTYASVRAIASGPSASVTEAITFIKAKVGSDRAAEILDPGQSVYFAATGLGSATGGPGLVETLVVEDRDRLINGLLAAPVGHVFIKLGPDGQIPLPYRGLLSVYRVVETKNGLQYLEPRGRLGGQPK